MSWFLSHLEDKPVDADRVNPAHPLAPDHAWTFAGAPAPNIASADVAYVDQGAKGTSSFKLNNNSGTQAAIVGGKLSITTATQEAFAYTDIIIGGVSSFTMMAVATARTGLPVRGSLYCDVAGSIIGYGSHYSTATGVFGYTGSGSTYAHNSTSGLFQLNRPTVWTQVYDGSRSTNDTKMRYFLDGRRVSMTFVGTVPTTIGAATYPVNIGGRTGTSNVRQWIGEIDAFYWWNRPLSNDEATAISEAPYQVFDSPRRAWWSMSAAAPPSFNPAWAANSTVTIGAEAA